jgi:hypothetical protein
MNLKVPAMRWPPFLRALTAPLTMIGKQFSRCFRFLLLNLIFGLMGVYVALLAPIFFADSSFSSQFEASLRAGAFYTFTIAFLSSTAVLLLESTPRSPDKWVARLKPTLVLIVLAMVVFSTIGAVMQTWLEATHATRAASAYTFQYRLFAAGAAISFYCFLVAIYEEELDNFAASDTARREDLARDASSVSSDDRGIAV